MKASQKFAAYFAAVIAMVLLTGCLSTTPPAPTYKYVLVTPSAALLMDCLVEPPPSKAEYLSTDPNADPLVELQKRERLLIQMGQKQNKNTDLCNGRFKELREWKRQQEDLYLRSIPKPTK